ncbi:MAG: protein kinase [Planctomycetes bacterium]|nr:protein kinase [Planctomycetota bacterium]
MTRRIGPYEVVRELGRGGMGVVYEVTDPALPRRLALKLILDHADPDALARFGREVELLARVRHPNVVAVHAVGRAPEGPYVLMDLVEGEPLSRLVGRLDAARAVEVVRALCDAVGALHAQGVLHRDLKPQNVIVRPDGRPVLLDFGLACDPAGGRSLTRTGQVLGTPRYMAPEQAEGKTQAPLDARADVYGLGAVLFELLAGAPPFAEVDGGPWALLLAVVEREPRWPEVDPALGTVLRRAMAKRPDDRYATAAELSVALRQATEGTLAPPPRGRWGLVAAALALLIILCVGSWSLRPPTPAEVSPSEVAATSTGDEPPVTPPSPAPSREDARTLRPAPGAPGEAAALVWLDERRLATGTRAQVAVWDPEHPGEPRLRWERLEGLGRWLSLGPDVLWAAREGDVGVIPLDDGPPGMSDLPESFGVTALASAPDGQPIVGVTAPERAALIFYPGDVDGAIRLGRGEGPGLVIVVASPEGDRLAATITGDAPATSLRVWSWPGGEPLAAWGHPPESFASLAAAPRSTLIAAGTTTGFLRLFDLATLGDRGAFVAEDATEQRLVPSAHVGHVQALAFSPDGEVLFSVAHPHHPPDAPSELRVWRVANRALARTVALDWRVGALAASPDGRWLALARTDGRVELWSAPALRR